jgi:pantothenate kinase
MNTITAAITAVGAYVLTLFFQTSIETIDTNDGVDYPQQELKERGILKRKGTSFN